MPGRAPASQWQVEHLLSQVAIQHFQDSNLYVAKKVFPTVTTAKKTATYRVWNKGDILRLQAQRIDEGVASPLATVNFSDANATCEKFGLRDYVTPEQRANNSGPLTPEELVTLELMQGHLTTLEREWATAFLGTGKWSTDRQGVAAGPVAGQFLQWDATGSNPPQDVANWKSAVFDLTGRDPNVLLLAKDVWEQLKNHSTMTGRHKDTETRIVTPQLAAQIFEVEEVLIGSAVYNSAVPGATDVIAKIFENCALLAYRNKTPSPKAPSAGYTFVWDTPDDAPPGLEVVVKSYFNALEGERTDYWAVAYWKQVLAAADMAAYAYDIYG